MIEHIDPLRCAKYGQSCTSRVSARAIISLAKPEHSAINCSPWTSRYSSLPYKGGCRPDRQGYLCGRVATAMEISHRRLNRVDVVTVVGRLTAAEAPLLQGRLNQLFDEGRYRIVLDFAGLEYVSSPGLRVLIEARKRAREWKLTDFDRGDVRIVNLPTRIKEVFDLTGFTSLFHIYDDLVEAVGSF